MKTCKKRIYIKKKYAKQKIKELKNKRNQELRAYKCEKWGYYHLTSKVSIKEKEYYRKNKVSYYKYKRYEKDIIRAEKEINNQN